MNTIGSYGSSPYKNKMEIVGLLQTMVQNENKMPQSIIGFRNQGINEEESKEKKSPGLGVVKAGGEFIPKTEESIRKSQQEQALFVERVQKQTIEESAEDKALKAKQWEYIHLFPTTAWSEADKKRIFNNRQICLDADGSVTLTEDQISFLKNKYDMNRLTAEDAYYLLCDLTEMNVLSSEECKALLYSGIEISVDDLSKLQYTTERGTWGWMLDEETGETILVNSKSFYKEEDEEEDPALIKARIKGYTDGILLAAFCPEDKKEMPSPEELQSEQALKENAEGITGEMEARLLSGERITGQEILNGGANSGFLLDVTIQRWNAGEHIKGITKAAYQDPGAAARVLQGYKKNYDACDKFLKLVDQVKR